MLSHLAAVVLIMSFAVVDESMPARSLEDAHRRIELLEKDNRLLRARVLFLEAELARLKPVKSPAEPPAEEAIAAAPAEVVDETAPAEVGNPAEPPAEKTASPRAAPTRTYGSVLEILNRLPLELRPKPDGEFEKFKTLEREQWFQKEIYGQRFTASVPVDRVHVTRIPFAKDQEWMVTVYFKSIEMPYSNRTIYQSIGAYSFHTESEAAQRYEKVKPGTLVQVSGIINSVRFGLPIGKKSNVIVELDEKVFKGLPNR